MILRKYFKPNQKETSPGKWGYFLPTAIFLFLSLVIVHKDNFKTPQNFLLVMCLLYTNLKGSHSAHFIHHNLHNSTTSAQNGTAVWWNSSSVWGLTVKRPSSVAYLLYTQFLPVHSHWRMQWKVIYYNLESPLLRKMAMFHQSSHSTRWPSVHFQPFWGFLFPAKEDSTRGAERGWQLPCADLLHLPPAFTPVHPPLGGTLSQDRAEREGLFLPGPWSPSPGLSLLDPTSFNERHYAFFLCICPPSPQNS